jgi:hypothetical protein
VNNDVTTLIDLSGLDTVEGNVHISDNGVTTVIDLSGLDAVGGNVDISDNGATTLIDLSGLDTVGGNVNISDNGVTTVIDLGQVQHVGGDLKITNNDSATEIDLGQVRHLGGDLTVLNNGSATVTMPSGEVTVNGDVTIESTGSGTFSAMLCAAGSTDIEATGYATVVATTAQTGTTQVTSVDDSAIEITLQPGTFSGCTNFSLTRVAVSPDKGTDENGNPIVADVVGAYHIAFDVPTLGHPATLTFQIILANLSAALQNEVLDALNAGILHLVTQGDAPDAPYQVFPVCTAGQAPTDGGCVLLETLDADGNPTAASPAIVRFTGVVGHFSTWAVAIVTPIGAPAAIFNGLLQPYPAPPVTATPSFKRGRVVPVKFNWVDATGNVLDSATANPMILVLTANCEAQPGTTTAVTVDDPGESGWHYDAETRTWGFGWNTRKLGAGCYWLRMLTGAPEFQAPQQLFPIALH